jgi:TDG/mug DNA glycosylase family protein
MLPDVLDRGLNLVVCGSAAGTRSALAGCYYAGPGNKFWRTLAQTRLTPNQLAPAEFMRLLDFRIGLTDLVQGQAGADAVIRFHASERERLRRRILRCQPRYLCFNGKRAAQEYFRTRTVEFGPHCESIGTTRIFVAPSTSGAANRAWDVKHWHRLARLVAAHDQ